MKYFDAHCHVQLSQYNEDRPEVLQRMAENEIGGLVVGVDKASSQNAVTLVQDKSDLFASVGSKNLTLNGLAHSPKTQKCVQ
jgi:TatD DNase family protein